MGTSRSNSWRASALVFSGRQSPTWPLANAQALALIGIWNGLPATDAAMPNAPALGYRGSILDDGTGREWRVHAGVVVSTSGADIETRSDAERRFERALLATAPPGTIPPGIVL